jgi:hypothetical protein
MGLLIGCIAGASITTSMGLVIQASKNNANKQSE